MQPLVTLVIALLVAVALPAAARAHASLVGAEPADGAVLAQTPETLRLTFNEPVAPLVLTLVDAAGVRHQLAGMPAGDGLLEVPLPASLGTGTHALSYRVVSADGHPVGGTLVFSVGEPGAVPAPSPAGTGDLGLRIAVWLARVALSVALFIGVGGAFFTLWIARRADPPAGAAVRGALGLGLVVLPIAVGLQGLDALAAPFDALTQGATWRAGLGSSFALTALAAGCACALALGALAAPPCRGRWLALAALLVAAAAPALSGHASVAAPQWLTRPAVLVHALGLAVWLGALAPLFAVLRRVGAEQTAVLARFSRLILPTVGALAAAGIVLAIVQLGRTDALWTTAYGAVFIAKLALLVPLLGLAALNRLLFAPRLMRGGEEAATAFARSVAGEIALVLAILATAALWRFTPPPRALALAGAAPATLHIHTPAAMADVTAVPGRAGRLTATIVLTGGDFRPLAAREVTLVLAQPAAGIEPIERRAHPTPDGVWRVEDLVVPLPGRWRVRVDALVGDFDKAMLEGDIDIRQ
ncbi:copper resistance protein CopC [Chelatococcus sp. SYSU_G07232]|uniref:Copper resistance protein CopC n=1 Tax=Chelatococcus albus TaxID=3047466 RepID=A0ABT7AHQ9_9HYPH|nr:copper resistance protein CopC [Chelatococcus sp. SYSU_G07232]MDJ1158931.1 copper resistance protein CopC [Chelatococcus sp. SYSU_G07232]